MFRSYSRYLLASLAAASVYVPGFSRALLADDWAVIQRNLDLSIQDVPRLLSTTHGGWYRPVFDLFIGACSRFSGFDASGYHAVAFVIYIIVAVLVADVAATLTGSPGVGIVAALLFGIHSAHAEPVLWVSASNELLAGLFTLLSLRSYLAFRASTRRAVQYALTVGCYLLAIGAKETAIFLPVALGVYELLTTETVPWNERLRRLTPIMPLVAIQAVFVTFRFWTGSPYPVEIDPFRIVINLAYYLAVGIFALPDNYGYATSLPLWREQPLLPIVAAAMTACALGIAGWLFVAARQKTPERSQQALWFAAWWSLIALYPVILTATGRTAFMSSIGIAWMLAIGWAAIWQVADRRRTWCAVALILLVGTYAGVASYRAYWWRQAGNEMERTIARIDASLTDIPPGAAVCVIGLPDHLHHAYVFRNAFPALNQVRFPDHIVHAFLDSESDAALQDERCAHSIIVGAQRCCAPRRPSRRSAAAPLYRPLRGGMPSRRRQFPTVLTETLSAAAIRVNGCRSSRYIRRSSASSHGFAVKRPVRSTTPQRRRCRAIVAGLQWYRFARVMVVAPASYRARRWSQGSVKRRGMRQLHTFSCNSDEEEGRAQASFVLVSV